MMPPLSELAAKAYRARNGELAWERSDAIEAARMLAAAGFAILGGEVWQILGDGRWNGLIPHADDGMGGVWHWECEPAQHQPSETWELFCERAGAYTVQLLERINVERYVAPDLLPSLRHNMTYISQTEA